MDNQHDQSKVAYENGPKEVNEHKGLPSTKKQFGKHTMPQDHKPATKGYVKKVMKEHNLKYHSHGRHKEHR